VFTAWVQRRDAHALTKKINTQLQRHGAWNPQWDSSSRSKKPKDVEDGQPPGNEKTPDHSIGNSPDDENKNALAVRQFEWTHVHSFVAVMGGFVVDTTKLDANDQYLPGTRTRITLAPNGVHGLAKYELHTLPDISVGDIEDKSKSDSLAKFIVCIQSIWFSVQIVFRMAQGLPIALLELNTFAHAICTLLIFGLWWDKPLNIEQPILIQDKRVHDLCALICFCSVFEPSADSDRVEFRHQNSSDKEEQGSGDIGLSTTPTELQPENQQWASELPDSERESGELVVGSHVLGTAAIFAKDTKWLERPERSKKWLAKTRSFSKRDRTRWIMAHVAYKRYEIEKGQKYSGPYWSWLPMWFRQSDISFDNGARDRMRNTPVDFPFDEVLALFEHPSNLHDALRFLFAFTFAGLIYGGLHLFAWNSPFTGRVQQLLWEISGITIISSGAVLFLFAVAFSLKGKFTIPRSGPLEYVLSVFLYLYFIFYLCARIFLVVECFISFAYLPDAVFQDVKWSGYFPHIQ